MITVKTTIILAKTIVGIKIIEFISLNITPAVAATACLKPGIIRTDIGVTRTDVAADKTVIIVDTIYKAKLFLLEIVAIREINAKIGME